MSYWKDGLSQLPAIDLCQEISLIFNRVRTCREPLSPINPFGLCIMSGSNEVVIVAYLLIESTKLDEPIAHDIRVWREARFHLIHGVSRHLRPVFLVAINHFQLTTEAICQGRCHFQVFFTRAIPLFFLLGTNHDVEAIGMQTMAHHLVKHHTAVDTSRKKKCYPLVLYFIIIYHSPENQTLFILLKCFFPTFMRSKPKP